MCGGFVVYWLVIVVVSAMLCFTKQEEMESIMLFSNLFYLVVDLLTNTYNVLLFVDGIYVNDIYMSVCVGVCGYKQRQN